MSEITRVGVDLAKEVIQVNAVDAAGTLITNRQLSRDKFLPWCLQLPAGCVVAMEACGGVHYWTRKLIAMGLNAKIIAAHLVAPYRLQSKYRRQKDGGKMISLVRGRSRYFASARPLGIADFHLPSTVSAPHPYAWRGSRPVRLD
jgi:hypothetical protein